MGTLAPSRVLFGWDRPAADGVGDLPEGRLGLVNESATIRSSGSLRFGRQFAAIIRRPRHRLGYNETDVREPVLLETVDGSVCPGP
jgi:hypothetical protein